MMLNCSTLLRMACCVGLVTSFTAPLRTDLITSSASTNACTRTRTRTRTGNSIRLAGMVRTSSKTTTTTSLHSSEAAAAVETMRLVVVSPPGGIGEVTAVKAAELGASVRWFVVSSSESETGTASLSTSVFRLSPDSMGRISAAGGSIQLAGSNAQNLLLSKQDAVAGLESGSGSAVAALSAWCGSVDAMVCTFDGANAEDQANNAKRKFDEVDPTIAWREAIKIASREASKSVRGTKVVVLSASDATDTISGQNNYEGEGIMNKFSSIFKGMDNVPDTLTEAVGIENLLVLRHGQLFGTPESSPEFSPLVGGPRRVAELCEEYANRAIRVDPTLTVSGNYMMGQTTRSSRHTVGQAAALMTLGLVSVKSPLDVCVSSQLGTDPVSMEEWQSEFKRVSTIVSSGQAAQLFTTDFASVPDIERLADWLATKWAPAVLRTYEIAAIRTGARPVSANRAGPGQVEIIWQQLVNFDAVTVGRMFVQVTETGLLATRGPGNPSAGFGSVSRQPLAGEDVLVRRLAEAASQAIDKGLASKVRLLMRAMRFS